MSFHFETRKTVTQISVVRHPEFSYVYLYTVFMYCTILSSCQEISAESLSPNSASKFHHNGKKFRFINISYHKLLMYPSSCVIK